MADLKSDIVAMEKQTWEALKKSGPALVPFVTPDCVMIFPVGTIFSAHSEPPLLELLNRTDIKPWLEYEMKDVHVLSLADGAASISYEVEASREGLDLHALISSIWRQENGSWRMCLHQQTPV